MRNYIIFPILVLLVFGFAKNDFADEVLWQIGKGDHSSSEFALSGNRDSLIETPLELVDVFIGTGLYNRTFLMTSAAMPFGLVKLAPDTGGGTYEYDSHQVEGFCHIHNYCLGGLNVMPTTGPIQTDPALFASTKSKSTERAHPGYHYLHLDRYGIDAEITATTRVGVHRYTFPESEQSNVLLDIGRKIGETKSIRNAVLEKCTDNEITGYIDAEFGWETKEWTKLYFVAKFSRPFEQWGVWKDGKVFAHETRIEGDLTGAYVTFSTKSGENILLKFAVSYTSVEGARKNMETEVPEWDFDAVRIAAEKKWSNILGVFEIKGGRLEDRIKFYTALWHAMLGRDTTCDADGKYSVRGEIFDTPPGEEQFTHYAFDSLWNTFWNLNIVWSLGYPDFMNGWVRNLLCIYDHGEWLPNASVGNVYSQMMIATPATPLIVGAYMKGIRKFDTEKAYQAMRKHQTQKGVPYYQDEKHTKWKGIPDMDIYRKYDYVPHIASHTLEYCYDDWCVGQLAKALGKNEDAIFFEKAAQNYRNVWDPQTGFMRPRNEDGSFPENFNPFSGNGYTEANAWQYSWFVPHDVQGLINLMGGDDVFCEMLNMCFEKSADADFSMDFMDNIDAYLNHGNQPAMQVAFLFNYAGKPWLTQYWSREIMNKYYGSHPHDGYKGDEDQGQMGAWFVIASMGLFHVNGGACEKPFYDITTPLFAESVLHLDPRYYSGKTFTIIAENQSPENVYIQRAWLNDQPFDQCWIFHEDVVKGGTLRLELGPQPSSWGKEKRPISETKERFEFEITKAAIEPRQVKAGKPFHVTCTIRGKNATGTAVLRARCDDFTAEKRIELKPGMESTVELELVAYRIGRRDVQFSATAPKTYVNVSLSPAKIVARKLDIDQIPQKNKVVCRAAFRNEGGAAVQHVVDITVDNVLVEKKFLDLFPGKEVVVDFAHEFEDEGMHVVRVGDIEFKLLVGKLVSYSNKNCVLAFDFEADGHFVYDGSRYGNDGKITSNVPAFIKNGGGGFFDFSRGELVTVPCADEMNFDKEFSVSCRIKPHKVDVIESGLIHQVDRWRLTLEKNRVGLRINQHPTGWSKTFQSATELQAGQWYSVHATFSSTAGEIKIFVDGKIDSVHKIPQEPLTALKNAEIILGGGIGSFRNCYYGLMEKVLVFRSEEKIP